MPIKKDVKETIDFVKSFGLEVAMPSGSGHYKVTDPKSGTYLFGISSSPSDPNFRWMIMRHLRRLGLLREGKKRKGHKRKSAIDLAALKKAQDAAASAGERIPTLDDLEDSTEFFQRIKQGEDMPVAADKSRVNYTKQRLRKFLEGNKEKLEQAGRDRQMDQVGHTKGMVPGKGANTEFLRIAIEEVAPARGVQKWSSLGSGQQTLSKFLNDDKAGATPWVLNLMEATMDHIEGLKWNEIDESRKLPEPSDDIPIEELPPEIEEDELHMSGKETSEPPKWTVESIQVRPLDDGIRDRYADALLEVLAAEGSKTGEEILNRLDKLAGLV